MKIISQNGAFSHINFKGTDMNVLFFNDSHGSLDNLPSFARAVDEFKKENKDKTHFCMAGGDIFIGKNDNNKKTLLFMNDFLDATSMGNHDLEGVNVLNSVMDNIGLKFKLLSSNLNFTKKSPIESKIKKSAILERNGEKVGVIGVSPTDFKDLLFITKDNDFISVNNLPETLINIKSEINKLELKGINKIFLLAHTGKMSKDNENFYENFAKLGGIDVIIGGHDHNLENAWISSERNEPVLVAATGKTPLKKFGENLDMFGILNLNFNDDGVLDKDLTSVQFKDTSDYTPIKKVIDFIASGSIKEAPIYYFNKVPKGSNKMDGENKTASLCADSNLWYVNSRTKGKKADFAIINSGTIRSDFKSKKVSKTDIQRVTPFPQTLIKTELTKKQIIDALENGAKSCLLDKIMPGVLQVSGLRYSLDSSYNVKDVCLTDKNGNTIEQLDNVPDDKKYTVVYDDFLMGGVAGFASLKKDKDALDVEHFNVSRAEALEAYLIECKNKYSLVHQRIIKR